MSIRPISSSYRAVLKKGQRIMPRNMSSLQMSHEEHNGIHNIVMSIFEDCCNVGVPFQDALVALYLSGLQHGSEARK